MSCTYDVVIIGGGPSGLSAALALGRGRKRVLLCDAGPRRNAAAIHMQNFVTRDGTPPDEFRQIARGQLASYANVTIRDTGVSTVSGERNAFSVQLSVGDEVRARRILLATGMVDEMLPIEGFRELWGRSIFQCPYCHGWEIQDKRWGYLVQPENAAHAAPFSLLASGFTTRRLTVFGDLPRDVRAQLHAADIAIVATPVRRLRSHDGQLAAVELTNGTENPCEALFVHPPQHQVALVQSLGLAVEDGYLKVDPMTRETSRRGIYASGDLTTRMQSAIIAAASGMQAAAAINMELSADLMSAM
ncbi:MAG: NAD(P)/FAD-dependent oxidoreductase [Deltaproteobacteria bacterium]|nr:NAD(P)/FAD-dependent oxidoreductase [Deltaproteobacteria bacterium]